MHIYSEYGCVVRTFRARYPDLPITPRIAEDVKKLDELVAQVNSLYESVKDSDEAITESMRKFHELAKQARKIMYPAKK